MQTLLYFISDYNSEWRVFAWLLVASCRSGHLFVIGPQGSMAGHTADQSLLVPAQSKENV